MRSRATRAAPGAAGTAVAGAAGGGRTVLVTPGHSWSAPNPAGHRPRTPRHQTFLSRDNTGVNPEDAGGNALPASAHLGTPAPPGSIPGARTPLAEPSGPRRGHGAAACAADSLIYRECFPNALTSRNKTLRRAGGALLPILPPNSSGLSGEG